jgi:hypothetical protein
MPPAKSSFSSLWDSLEQSRALGVHPSSIQWQRGAPSRLIVASVEPFRVVQLRVACLLWLRLGRGRKAERLGEGLSL